MDSRIIGHSSAEDGASIPTCDAASLVAHLQAVQEGCRELDAEVYNALYKDGDRIAFRVEDWSTPPGNHLDRYHDGWLVGGHRNDRYANDLPRFTTSIDAARRLSQWVHRDGWLDFSFRNGVGEASQCFEGNRAYHSGKHSSLAVAICAAVAKASGCAANRQAVL